MSLDLNHSHHQNNHGKVGGCTTSTCDSCGSSLRNILVCDGCIDRINKENEISYSTNKCPDIIFQAPTIADRCYGVAWWITSQKSLSFYDTFKAIERLMITERAEATTETREQEMYCKRIDYIDFLSVEEVDRITNRILTGQSIYTTAERYDEIVMLCRMARELAVHINPKSI